MSPPINILLLIELVAIVIASSAFLFYLNRLGGSVLAFIIRFFIWRKHHVWVTIGSLQISLLAGRITFRDIEYHSSNISARALHGHITWRYWKFRIRQSDDVDSSNSNRNSLPCRIRVHTEGFEAFIYNRTPAYDEIVKRMEKHEAEAKAGKSENRSSEASSTSDHHGLRNRSSIRRDQTKGSAAESSEDIKSTKTTDPLRGKDADATEAAVDYFRELCPIEITVKQGSVVLGNDATPSVLIAHFGSAKGTINSVDSRSPCDLRKDVYDLRFEKVNILTRTNVDYSGPLLAHGKKAYDQLLKERPLTAHDPPSSLSARLGFHLIARKFAFLRDPKFSTPPVAGLPRDRVWRGLARYRNMDDEAPKRQPRREEREYAKVTTLLETARLDVVYYSDVPGFVPSLDGPVVVDPADEIGNVEATPEYGIDVTLHGGIIKYGPWADRQRDALQTAFAPSIFFDSDPKARLQTGDTRVHTHMLLNVNISEETTLRIPTREPSKDWQFDNKATAEEDRRYGWLDVVVGPNSSVVYSQSQIATTHGYDTKLELHLASLNITSSINFDTFVRSKACELVITMPTPLRWNAQRDWGFDVTLESPEITLLRDHTTLISDLARDWSSGLQGDFHHFVPNHYNFRVSILNYGIHLFLNDYNIIDDPRTRATNAMADFSGPRLDAYIAVATTQYRPEFSVVPFSVEARDIKVELGLPRWDTHRGVDGSEVIEVGKIGEITVEGSYRYYSEPKPEHLETLSLHLEGRKVAFKAFGWAIRRFFCVKDNYFGGFTSFRTMDEFFDRFDHDPRSVGDAVEEKYRPGRSDPYAVQVTMNVEDSLVVMPDQIYGCEKGVVIPVPKLQMSLRSQEQFMDLSLDSPPTSVIPVDNLIDVYDACVVPPIQEDAVFLEGIELKANRLFGPQPRAETYLCLWEAVVPRITCFLSVPFVTTLQSVLAAVAYNFTDPDNAPAAIYQPAALPDVTFFKLALGQATVLMSQGDSAISIELERGVNLDLSTCATRSCASSIGLQVPSLTVRIMTRRETRDWETVGHVTSGASVDVYNAPQGWRDAAAKQQAFIRREDAETRRIAYLYDDAKSARQDQYNHQVFIPTPRAPDDTSSDESVSTDEDDDIDEEEAASSPDNSESDEQISARPRRPRNVSTLRPHRRGSADSEEDESDAASLYSSASSSDSDGPPLNDMPSVLAGKLRAFRLQRRSFIAFAEESYNSHAHSTTLPMLSSLRSGSIVRITAQPVTIALQPEALQVGSSVAAALREAPRRSEVLLDSLLIAHTDELAASPETDDPTIIDVHLPRIHARIHHAPLSELSPIIDLQMNGVCVRLAKGTTVSRPTMNIAVLARKAELNLCTANPTMCLNTSPDANLPSASVTRILFEGLEVNLDQRHRHTRLVTRLSMLNTSIVTPAFQHIHDVAKLWQTAANEMPKPSDHPNPVAVVLYQAVRAAVEREQTLSQPAFAYESSYGLHVDDQRNIRRDLGWSILARARHWLRTLEMPKVRSTDNLAEYTIEQLASVEDWAGDSADFIRQQACMRLAFGDNTYQSSAGPQISLDNSIHVFANIDILHVEHRGKMLESDRIVSSSLRMLSASSGIQYLVAFKGSRKIKRIRAVNTVKAIETEIQNSLFGAIEPLLRLAPSSDSPEVDLVTVQHEGEEEQIIVMDNQIERAELVTVAAGLRLKGILDRGTVNVFAKSAKRSMPDTIAETSHVSVATMIRLIETSVNTVSDLPVSAALASGEVVAVCRLKELGGMVALDSPEDAHLPAQLRVLASLRAYSLDIRPEMKAIRNYIQHVKDQEYQHYETIIQEYRAVIERASKPKPKTPHRPVHSTVDLSLKSVDLTARAAASLWLRWEFGSTYITVSGAKEDLQFGLRMDPQLVGAYSTLEKSRSRDSSTLRLPTVKARGTYRDLSGQGALSGTLDLGVFTGVMQPATLNRLLDLHRDLGEDVVSLSQQYSNHSQEIKAEVDGEMETSSEPATKPWILDITVGMSGLQIGLRADKVATSVVFEASALHGYLSHSGDPKSSLMWQARAEQLGMSLGHLDSDLVPQGIPSSRRYRSASMVLDVDVQDIPGDSDTPRQLSIRLSRVHTIMHIAALKELVDLSRSWTYDIRLMQEGRAADIAEVKARSSKFKQKMQARSTRLEKPSSSAWLAERLVTVNMTGIGIAIPLDASTTIDMSTVDQKTGPALLFSIRTMGFQNKRNQTARFRMQQMELQFVDSFDQGKAEHFVGDYHPSDNRMIVPLIDSEAEISSEPGMWKMSAHCSATDFKLSLSPSIADSIFRLMSMYHRGKAAIAQLEEEYRNGLAQFGQGDASIAKYVEQSSIPAKLAAQQILIKMSFTFNSGIVLLSHKPLDKSIKPDRLVLPSISLWVDYTGASIGVDDSDDGGMLLVNSAVHESRNEVKPSLIPFIVDLVRRIRHQSENTLNTPSSLAKTVSPVTTPPAEQPINAGETALQAIAHAPTGRLKVRSTLRIDQSELKFSCGGGLDNMSDAMLNLTWSSGGFIANTTLGGDEVTSFAGTITGVNIQLRHEHAGPEKNCIQAGANDMAFTLAYCPSARHGVQRGLSFVFDSSVSAQFRLDAFSAWMCFMAVWVDDVWKFGAPVKPSTPDNPEVSSTPSSPPLRLGIVVLARFRTIDFDVNLPVTRARLQIAPLTIRTLADGSKTDLEVRFGTLSLHAKGDFSGDITSEHLAMHSTRSSSRTPGNTGPSILTMSIDAGALSGDAYLEQVRIVQFHLAPTKVHLADDWSSHQADHDKDVILAFTINAGKFTTVVRLEDLPRLLGSFYDIVREAEIQETRAKIWSTPFRENKERKADQPSTITAALLQTARRTSLTGDSTGQMKLKQAMKLDLNGIDLGMFVLDRDSEEYREAFHRFEIGSTNINLTRDEDEVGHRLRNLEILIGFARMTYHKGDVAVQAEKTITDLGAMIAEIAKQGKQRAWIPHGTVTMASKQIPTDSADILEHDCSMFFDTKNDSTFAAMPVFWTSAQRAYLRLEQGLDEQQHARARDRDSFLARTRRVKTETPANQDEVGYQEGPVFKRIGGTTNVPNMELLGPSTKKFWDLAEKQQWTRVGDTIPAQIHRFVTLPLEDAMDQLSKLYQKQLPVRSDDDEAHQDNPSSATSTP